MSLLVATRACERLPMATGARWKVEGREREKERESWFFYISTLKTLREVEERKHLRRQPNETLSFSHLKITYSSVHQVISLGQHN